MLFIFRHLHSGLIGDGLVWPIADYLHHLSNIQSVWNLIDENFDLPFHTWNFSDVAKIVQIIPKFAYTISHGKIFEHINVIFYG